jgi:hypothetical protein
MKPVAAGLLWLAIMTPAFAQQQPQAGSQDVPPRTC